MSDIKNEQDVELAEVSPKDSSTAEVQELYIPKDEENKLVRKLDRHIMPIFCMLYFLSFLERNALGVSRVAGMQEQLGITDAQFSTAVSIFYATYVTVELPGAILVKRIGAQKFMTCALTAWSLVTIFTCLVRSYGSLLVTRILLGLFEGSVFPAQTIYITMTYKKEEQNKRVGYLFICSCLSGAFGGLIGTGITKIKTVGTFESWGWLYVIEGGFSLLFAIYIWFALPDDPKKGKFLNSREKDLMYIRAEQVRRYLGNDEFEWKEVRMAMTDIKVYLSCIIQFCCDIVLYGYSTFLPSILKLQLGYSSLEAQYLSVPCYIVAAIGVGTVSYCSDKYGYKYIFIVGCNTLAMIGYIILLVNKSGGANYFATYLIGITLYGSVGVNFTWLTVNNAPHYRRATAVGMNQMLGNISGAVAGQVYRSSPYKLGNGFSLGCVIMGMCTSTVLMLHFRRQNKIKEQILSGERVDTMKERTGDRELDFKYTF